MQANRLAATGRRSARKERDLLVESIDQLRPRIDFFVCELSMLAEFSSRHRLPRLSEAGPARKWTHTHRNVACQPKLASIPTELGPPLSASLSVCPCARRGGVQRFPFREEMRDNWRRRQQLQIGESAPGSPIGRFEFASSSLEAN